MKEAEDLRDTLRGKLGGNDVTGTILANDNKVIFLVFDGLATSRIRTTRTLRRLRRPRSPIWIGLPSERGCSAALSRWASASRRAAVPAI